jgi:hypothetical protein
MSRKRPPASPPQLGWLRQSVWAGEELPDELEMLEAAGPAAPKRRAAPRRRRKRGSKPVLTARK